ncbi:MAG: PHP domain-containing protein [Promethearchaeia archaeon]
MNFPKINLHIHSSFSDGKNSIKQIVKKAVKCNFKYIAITDHFTSSWKSRIIPSLNNSEKIKFYLKIITKHQKALEKANIPMKVLKGIEIDIGSSEKFINSLINPEKFDLILFEYLEMPEGILFIKKIIDFWKKNYTIDDSPIFGLAHFDPSFFIYGGLELLIQFLKDYNIYFEFNSRYPENYSIKNGLFFEKLKEMNIPIALGSDSHSLGRIDDVNELYRVIDSYQLKENLKLLLNKLKKLYD